jgi:hypothetical protein
VKDVVDAVADSIVAEVANASAWNVNRFAPVWRNPVEGESLYVYATTVRPGTFRTTGSAEDTAEVVVEYAEPVYSDVLTRDETAELAAYDVADSIKAWSRDHQAFGAVGVHAFDLVRLDYASGVNREAFVRYCRLTFEARVVQSYG